MAIKVSTSEVTKAGVVGFLGTFLDGYDLIVAATAAPLVFDKVFFPAEVEPTLAFVYSLLVVTLVTFLFRPLGAILFGHLGDRLGRRVGLLWDLVLAGLGTLIIGLAPPYSQAGYLGLAMLIVGRILVGIGLGGEQGGAVTLVLEQAYAAGSRRRAFWAAVPYMAWAFVAIAVSGIFALLLALYPGKSFLDFGWRIAFYIGAAAAVIGIVVRFLLLESVPFEEAKRTVGVSRAPWKEVFRHWKPLMATAFVYALGSNLYYLWTTYSVNYATNVGFDRGAVLATIAVGGVALVFFLSMFTLLADRVGRRPVVLSLSLVSIPVTLVWPLLILSGSLAALAVAQVMLTATLAGIQGPLMALAAEHFPTRYRYTGTGLGVQLGAILDGGIGVSTLVWIVGKAYVEMWWAIPAVMWIYSILSILGILIFRETARETLRH